MHGIGLSAETVIDLAPAKLLAWLQAAFMGAGFLAQDTNILKFFMLYYHFLIDTNKIALNRKRKKEI